ncbi:hypothetical protein [Ferrimonas sp. SCSIO 43195]|uniref:hypothetical protein n=1 Tax=Ferrimonas sp. SCSIO 43195 TaxID=2822844 RepID=UPI0020752E26|nr:hypothetical protein [Ferrimonas sp. SCSIO 43195]USD39588.1 hypothetical protein J8Z22_11125 [Ferrimonas sp. SCSIO 43195]
MLYKWKNPGQNDSDIDKVKEISLSSSNLKEKDLENIIAKRIDDLVRTDQLMILMQERQRQEEPDIIAIDQEGTIHIFELKRWEGRSENILQVLRYGQKFGRYDYEKLNWFYQSYRRGKHGEISLQEAHKDFFDLEDSLNKDKFNAKQRFVVVTHGLDYDTWDAIAYWKAKGIDIIAQVYRTFKIKDDAYIDFDPFGPIPDAPKQQESGLYVVNTNKTYMPNVYTEMVKEKKGSAYYEKKYSIQNISAGSPVCLYHVGTGVIGIGKSKTDYVKKDINGDSGEEYYIPIDFEYLVDIEQPDWQRKAVRASEINNHFNSSHRFRQTVFQLPYEFSEFIRKRLADKGVPKA